MTHMDDSILLFPEPAKFDPSRFDKQASVPPYCFVPFGGGPRICPGYEFARIETLIAMHHIVTQFTWKLCADNHFSRAPMPVPTGGLPIEIKPRTWFWTLNCFTNSNSCYFLFCFLFNSNSCYACIETVISIVIYWIFITIFTVKCSKFKWSLRTSCWSKFSV